MTSACLFKTESGGSHKDEGENKNKVLSKDFVFLLNYVVLRPYNSVCLVHSKLSICVSGMNE